MRPHGETSTQLYGFVYSHTAPSGQLLAALTTFDAVFHVDGQHVLPLTDGEQSATLPPSPADSREMVAARVAFRPWEETRPALTGEVGPRLAVPAGDAGWGPWLEAVARLEGVTDAEVDLFTAAMLLPAAQQSVIATLCTTSRGEQVMELLRRMAHKTDGVRAVNLLCLLGLAAYLCGDGVLAGAAYDRMQGLCAENRWGGVPLAGLLLDVRTSLAHPDEVRRRLLAQQTS